MVAPDQIEDATLYLGDCLEVMAGIPDGSVDMILADLPYGATRNRWDSMIPLEPLWAHYKRIVKPKGAIALTAQSPFDKVLGCSNLAWLRHEWVWVKAGPTGHLNANRAPLKAHELVLIFASGLGIYNPQMGKGHSYAKARGRHGTNYGKGSSEQGFTFNHGTRYPTSVLQVPHDAARYGGHAERTVHPTQKPVALFAYLIRTYTNPGDMVLDSCAGSGTTGVACQQEGRRCILIEKDANYYQTMRDRLSAPRQTRLAEGA